MIKPEGYSRTQRAAFTLEQLRTVIARPATELSYVDEYELIVAVILSAQCTDARVNLVTPELFAAFPTFAALAQAEPTDVVPFIRSISYPNNKAKSLVRMARQVQKQHGGQLPRTQKALLTLAGVGRKTAQVVASVAFGDPEALPVDTHVFRVANRIGLVHNAPTPLKVERGLKSVLPRGSWGEAHHLLILHGRYTCTARRPQCASCVVAPACQYYAAHQRLPKPLEGLDPSKGAYYCKTRRHYFDHCAARTDRAGVSQNACPRCGSMNVFRSSTGMTTKTVRDYRI